MKFILFPIIALLMTPPLQASCGAAPDPFGDKLEASPDSPLADSLQALLAANDFVAIARVDSFFCLDTVFGYPTYSCDVKVAVDTVIQGEMLYPVFESRTFDFVGRFMLELSGTRFLIYGASGQTKEIPVHGGCYSPNYGYYVHGSRLHNQHIDTSGYLPLESIGWSTPEPMLDIYWIWQDSASCIDYPCRSFFVYGIGPVQPVVDILDTNGNPVSQEIISLATGSILRGTIVQGREEPEKRFILERIFGKYIYDPRDESSRLASPVERVKKSGIGISTHDALGRGYGTAVRNPNAPGRKHRYMVFPSR